jgi:hypothetical protein
MRDKFLGYAVARHDKLKHIGHWRASILWLWSWARKSGGALGVNLATSFIARLPAFPTCSNLVPSVMLEIVSYTNCYNLILARPFEITICDLKRSNTTLDCSPSFSESIA